MIDAARRSRVVYGIGQGQRAEFENCASRVLDARSIARALEAIDGFEQMQRIADFTAMLEPASAGVKSEADPKQRVTA